MEGNAGFTPVRRLGPAAGMLLLILMAGKALGAAAGNPAGGAIRHHALAAAIDTATARLSVIDTLTISHDRSVPASRSFPFLLASGLVLEKATGIGVAVTAREERLRPRDYWFSPPYDELGGFERARSVMIELGDRRGTWPESVRVVVAYAGVVYDSLRPPKAAYARGFELTAGLIDPRGAFLSGGTFWIPSRPDERFTFRCALATPPGWHGISQGALIESDEKEGRRVDTWDCPHPMEETYFIGGPYTFRQEMRRGVSVMTFTYANTDAELCKRYIDGTERYLALYGDLIGPYPFAKFALVENFWQTGFGMPSFTLLGDQVIRLPFILDTSYGHEILHNWWGNGVFVDYTRGNWCEGLTTYGADYLYKERQSVEEARDYRRSTLQGYLDYVSESEDKPLRLFREREDFATQAIGYGKSMMVFHQIRRLLGDHAYWGALRSFYKEHLFRRASWDDLFEAFGRAAGRDLAGLKDQWIEKPGAPALALGEHRVSGSKRDGFTVTAVVVQTQPEGYELTVPVRLGWNEPAAESTQVVVLDGKEAVCTFHVARPPDWIAVDPDFDVLRRIDPAEIPPALSRTLGADTAAIVIASGLPAAMDTAYQALANQWDAGAKLAVLHEAALNGAPPAGVPVWYFGVGPMARGLASPLESAGCRAPQGPDWGSGWTIAGNPYPPEDGIVIAGGPPEDPARAWSILAAGTPEQVATVGRKVPHYGKYSYLVFDADGKNVAKGSWEVRESPLRASLADERNAGGGR